VREIGGRTKSSSSQLTCFIVESLNYAHEINHGLWAHAIGPSSLALLYSASLSMVIAKTASRGVAFKEIKMSEALLGAQSSLISRNMMDDMMLSDDESLEELGRNADLRIYRLNGFVSRYRCYYRYIAGVDSKKSAQG